MKNIYLLLLFLCASLSGTAQTPFARTDAHWCTNYLSLGGIQYGEPWSMVDSVIMGIPCSYADNYGLFVKNDTVYRILRDSSIYFVYDYSAHKGDVWNVEIWPEDIEYFGPNYTSLKVHIDTAYSINVRGQTLRILNTTVTDTSNQPYIFQLGNIIEGVGGSYSFLPGPWGLVDLGVPYLQCYQDSMAGAFIISSNNELVLLDSCVCHIWMGENELSESIQLSVSPNPSANTVIVTIAGSETSGIVAILDITGRQLVQSQLNNGTTQFSVDSLPNGLYFVTVYNRSTSTTRKFVIQH